MGVIRFPGLVACFVGLVWVFLAAAEDVVDSRGLLLEAGKLLEIRVGTPIDDVRGQRPDAKEMDVVGGDDCSTIYEVTGSLKDPWMAQAVYDFDEGRLALLEATWSTSTAEGEAFARGIVEALRKAYGDGYEAYVVSLRCPDAATEYEAALLWQCPEGGVDFWSYTRGCRHWVEVKVHGKKAGGLASAMVPFKDVPVSVCRSLFDALGVSLPYTKEQLDSEAAAPPAEPPAGKKGEQFAKEFDEICKLRLGMSTPELCKLRPGARPGVFGATDDHVDLSVLDQTLMEVSVLAPGLPPFYANYQIDGGRLVLVLALWSRRVPILQDCVRHAVGVLEAAYGPEREMLLRESDHALPGFERVQRCLLWTSGENAASLAVLLAEGASECSDNPFQLLLSVSPTDDSAVSSLRENALGPDAVSLDERRRLFAEIGVELRDDETVAEPSEGGEQP